MSLDIDKHLLVLLELRELSQQPDDLDCQIVFIRRVTEERQAAFASTTIVILLTAF